MAAHLVDFVVVQERPADPEAGHVSRAGPLDVPVAGGHGGVFLVEHGIEDRLACRRGGRSRHRDASTSASSSGPVGRHSGTVSIPVVMRPMFPRLPMTASRLERRKPVYTCPAQPSPWRP